MKPSWQKRWAILVAVFVLGAWTLAGIACSKKADEAAALVDSEDRGGTAPATPVAAAADPQKQEMEGQGQARGDSARLGALPAAPPPPAAKGRYGIAGPGEAPASGAVGHQQARTPALPALIPIDPNGRFATTYRPGGGHLAAFESAVARGIVPAGERELVSDVGARYATPMDAPKGKALAIRTDFERGKLPPSGSPFHMRVSLRSTAEKATERPHLSVHLVLDVSGSMAGESITRAREAARRLADKLATTDDFSLVTFSSTADVKIPDGPVGSRREMIKSTIDAIKEGGGTNIGAGLELAYKEASHKTIPATAVRVVLLLSDGRANSGITSPDRLSKLALDAFQQGIQTSSFGLGTDYDGALMSSIAEDGAGGYYYMRDAEQIAPALSTEIEKRLDPVATAVEVRVRLKKGVDLLRVYGSRRLSAAEASRVRAIEVAADKQAEQRDHIKQDRQDDTKGGMRFFIPAFARDDSHTLLLQLSVPAGVGSKPIALLELKYKDRVSKKNVSDETPISISYAASDGESGASIDASVARTVQGFAAGDTLSEAAARIARNDRAGAMAILSERENLLRQASTTLNEPLFLKDAERLARLRSHAGTETGMGDPLVLSMLLETAGRSHLR